MKRILFLFLLLGVIFPLKVNAVSGNIVVLCDKTVVKSGDMINCSVKGSDFIESVSSFHAVISLEDNYTLGKVSIGSSWYGSGEGGVIDLYTDINKKDDINFIRFEVKVGEIDKKSDSKILLKDIKIGDSKFVEYNYNDSFVIINNVLNTEEVDSSINNDTYENNENIIDNNEIEENIVNSVGVDNNFVNQVKEDGLDSLKYTVIIVCFGLLLLLMFILYKNIIRRKNG